MGVKAEHIIQAINRIKAPKIAPKIELGALDSIWPKMEQLPGDVLQIEKKSKDTLLRLLEQKRSEFYTKPVPPYQERYNQIINDMRTRYGQSQSSTFSSAEFYAGDEALYLRHMWARNPEARKIRLELSLLELQPEKLQLYQKAVEQMKKRGVFYDGLELLGLTDSSLKCVAEGIFARENYVFMHDHAFKYNAVLRNGGQINDTIKTILDEGFKDVEPMNHVATVYRTVVGGTEDKSIDFINRLINLKKGETFIDRGYSYSSYKRECACSCNGIRDIGTPEILIKMEVPVGAKTSTSHSSSQVEMLFPSNSEWEVIEPAKVIKPGVPFESNGKILSTGDYMEMCAKYVLPKL